MVPADSRRIPRAPRYSGYRYVSLCFAYGIITLYDVSFQKYNVAVLQPRMCIATPAVWALPRSLATTRGIISLFSLPPGTKMFQFPGLALLLGKSDSPSD